MSGRGRHPNSLAALQAHQRKPGDPPLPGAGRPRRPFTDSIEVLLQQPIPNSVAGAQLRAQLELPEGAVWLDAVNKSWLIRSLQDHGSLADLIDRIEGRPATRLHMAEPDAATLQIAIVHEDRKPRRDGTSSD